MKAITIKQPWASLIAIGAKRIETRSWQTKYRGPIAIHSSAHWSNKERNLVYTHPFDMVLTQDRAHRNPNFFEALSWQFLPTGKILATANLVDCIPTEKIPYDLNHPHADSANAFEEHFGDYLPGRFAWILEDVKALKEPMDYRGSLGLWDIPAEFLRGR